MVCPLCFYVEESHLSLFLLCPIIFQVWKRVYIWIGIDSVLIQDSV